jgi:hypothetical protein
MSHLEPRLPRCKHVKVNGTRCQCPALRDQAYCYFHYRSRVREGLPAAPTATADGRPSTASFPKDQRQTATETLPSDRPCPIPVPADLFLLEDACSIQCSLQWVLRRILDGSMEYRQAALLLHGLQIAAGNAKAGNFNFMVHDVIHALPAEQRTGSAPKKARGQVERAPGEASAGEAEPVAPPRAGALQARSHSTSSGRAPVPEGP